MNRFFVGVYVVTGKPVSTTETNVGVSVDINNASSGTTFTANFDRVACVNKDTGAIATDGPTGFGTTVAAIEAALTSWNDLAVTTALSWTTIDDMLTSAL